MTRSGAFILVAILIVAIAVRAAEVEQHALAPRTGPRGDTMYRSMPAEETGIITVNPYDDPRMWGTLHREFLYGGIGTGIAIADYDNDGRPDVFVVAKAASCRLFRNLGNWKFENVTESARVGDHGDDARVWKQGAVFADVNNDGWLDVYVCRFGAPNLLHVNQGDGTFREEAAARGLAMNDASVIGAFCDYDRDGWLDVFVVTNALDYNASIGRPDRLFRNRGDGTFTDVTVAAGISDTPDQGHAAIWSDFTGDGWPDLYVANDFEPPDFLYVNRGDGTFFRIGGLMLSHTPNSSMGVDVGDVNNDGLLDFLVADMAATTHEKDIRSLANSRATFRVPVDDPALSPQVQRNALFLGTGELYFREAALLAGLGVTNWTWAVRLEDFDNDSRVDAFFTTGMVRELHNADLRERLQLAGSLGEQVRILKASPAFPEGNLAFRNLGSLEFAPAGSAWGLDQSGVSFGCATGDFDGDGDLDLVVANYEAGVSVLRNDSDSGHRITVSLRGTTSNRFGIGATILAETSAGKQIRPMLIARGYASSSEPVAHFGLGDDERIDVLTITWPSGHVQTLRGLSTDRNYIVTEPPGPARVEPTRPPQNSSKDFVEISRPARLAYIAREAAFDETIRQPLAPRTFNAAGPAIAVGDLNGDGADDLCLGGTTLDAPRVLLADGQGYFGDSGALATFGNTAVNDGPVLILDADGDHDNDVLITAGGVSPGAGSAAYQPRLLLNSGRAKFHAADADALPAFPQPVGAAGAADFDRDGRLDVCLGGRVVAGKYPHAPRSALLRNRGGRFEDVTANIAPELATIGLVTSALWSDVDGDGWIDLLLALELGTIRFLRNVRGERFEDRSGAAGFAAAGTGWWSSLAAADFNGDRQPDYVAGNLGLNTPYRATADRPSVLLSGRFAGSAAPVLIEAFHEDDRLVPRAAHREITAALPALRKRFPRTDEYARAALTEVFDAADLAGATEWNITELRSGVFLSQPDGTFRFAPFERDAQIAPLQGIATADFNGDGHTDIAALQNDYRWKQSLGRFDGGLGQILHGDGHGGFTVVPANNSGWVVPGDPRALALVDFDRDAWPDLFVSRSRSPTLAWQNRGSASERRSCEIRLRGAVGNRTAVGARVTVESANGSTQTGEVSAGGGVFSQHSAALYFGLPGDQPLRRILVRWPDGRTSEHPYVASTRHVVLDAPAP